MANRLQTTIKNLVLIQMLTTKDDEAYFELQNNNADYWKEFGNNIDQSVNQVTKRRLQHGEGRYGIWFKEELIGMIGYSTKHHPNQAEIGILLAKSATGHGYATAAIQTLTDYAKPRFDRVYAEVEPNNSRSISLLKRTGYQTDGKIVDRDWGRALVFEAG